MTRQATGPSRRGFLMLGGAAAASAAVMGLAGIAAPGGEHYGALLNGEVPQVLSEKELAVLSVAAETLVGAIPGLPSIHETRTPARIDRELSLSRGTLLSDMKASLLYLEYSPLMGTSLSRFSSMGAQEREAHLRALSRSEDPLERAIYNGVRFLVFFFYYTDPRTWAHLGYEGPQVPAKFFPAGNRIENLEALS